MELFTDASGKDGWGANWAGRWISARWSRVQTTMSIVWKELYAIVTSAHSWGPLWQRRKILVHCDNLTVVGVWEIGTSKSPEIMALVHILFYCAAHINFNICVQHLPGIDNLIADTPSHFQQDRFRRLAPKANLHPDNIPSWPQQAFTATSCSADIMVLPSQPVAHTNQA